MWEAQGLSLQDKYDDAIIRYRDALALLGDKEVLSSYACSIYQNIGEIYWEQQSFTDAFHYINLAVKCDGGLGSWSIHLRLGQIHFEQGNMKKAQDELMRAYMGGGLSAFEEEDPKYYALIQPHVERE